MSQLLVGMKARNFYRSDPTMLDWCPDGRWTDRRIFMGAIHSADWWLGSIWTSRKLFFRFKLGKPPPTEDDDFFTFSKQGWPPRPILKIIWQFFSKNPKHIAKNTKNTPLERVLKKSSEFVGGGFPYFSSAEQGGIWTFVWGRCFSTGSCVLMIYVLARNHFCRLHSSAFGQQSLQF